MSTTNVLHSSTLCLWIETDDGFDYVIPVSVENETMLSGYYLCDNTDFRRIGKSELALSDWHVEVPLDKVEKVSTVSEIGSPVASFVHSPSGRGGGKWKIAPAFSLPFAKIADDALRADSGTAVVAALVRTLEDRGTRDCATKTVLDQIRVHSRGRLSAPPRKKHRRVLRRRSRRTGKSRRRSRHIRGESVDLVPESPSNSPCSPRVQEARLELYDLALEPVASDGLTENDSGDLLDDSDDSGVAGTTAPSELSHLTDPEDDSGGDGSSRTRVTRTMATSAPTSARESAKMSLAKIEDIFFRLGLGAPRDVSVPFPTTKDQVSLAAHRRMILARDGRGAFSAIETPLGKSFAGDIAALTGTGTASMTQFLWPVARDLCISALGEKTKMRCGACGLVRQVSFAVSRGAGGAANAVRVGEYCASKLLGCQAVSEFLLGDAVLDDSTAWKAHALTRRIAEKARRLGLHWAQHDCGDDDDDGDDDDTK